MLGATETEEEQLVLLKRWKQGVAVETDLKGKTESLAMPRTKRGAVIIWERCPECRSIWNKWGLGWKGGLNRKLG